jgi:CRP-like cAMP-binding protein
VLTNQAVSSANHLFTILPDVDRERLIAISEPVELSFAEVLYSAGDTIPHVYFPTGGFISLLTPVSADTGLEVGLIGREGVLGITLMLDIAIAPFQARVQGAGTALRINTALFLRELEQSLALRQVLKRYLYVSMRQLAQTATCNRFHLVAARLARWLLMTHDRSDADTFHVTHVFLAYILGVRRVGITKAAHSLQQQKLISYRRGDITILDRNGLKALACACYQIDLETYRSNLG